MSIGAEHVYFLLGCSSFQIRLVSLDDALVVIQPYRQPLYRSDDPGVPVSHMRIELEKVLFDGYELVHGLPDMQVRAGQDLAIRVSWCRHCHEYFDKDG